MAPLISVRELEKRFDALEIVRAISFDIAPGECVGLLGPNGAGKTSTLKMLVGQMFRTGGEVEVFGIDPERHPVDVKGRLGVVTQDDTTDPDLTVEQNLVVFAGYFGIRGGEATRRARDLLEFVHLTEKRREKIENLSGGMKRRLLIARALVNAPELLVLDEPTTGLDPQARHLIWQKLRLLKRQGTTMLLTTHYMEEAEQLCDRILIMDGGRILDSGSPESLVARHVGAEVVEVFLGDREPAEVLGTLGSPVPRHEITNDMLYLYLDGQADIAARVRASGFTEVIQRPATLEDVFLKVAGREISE
ncbi:MAG: ABC transporter ATP-binding protein [Deltaproteobacteria bacterium]|nr:ABC transporter ATP-binding protein [Deltaproteobacteria bacterium]